MSYPVLSIQKRQAYYDEWLLSGEPQPQFLKRHNLGPSLFKTKGLIKQSSVPVAPKPLQAFLPLHVKQEPAVQTSNLFVQFSNGARLYFVTGTPVEYMGSLIASVESRGSC